jgi:hypothetical protein
MKILKALLVIFALLFSFGAHAAEYTVQAFTTFGGLELESNIVHATTASVDIYAGISHVDGATSFDLYETAGTVENSITLHNSLDVPVRFVISQPGTPFDWPLVIPGHRQLSVPLPN